MRLGFYERGEFLKISAELSDSEREIISEYLSDGNDYGDFEVLFGYISGCLILRYYSSDAGYHFESPIPLSSEAEIEKAFLAVSEYCKREAIPEIYVGVSEEDIPTALRGAESYETAQDEDGTYLVIVYTECQMCDELPEVMYEDVYLGEFASAFADDYERIVKNVNLNRYFGYNVMEDHPEATGKELVQIARGEFENGEAMNFAATVLSGERNVFIGEGTLSSFDGRGGASVAFRVLPEWQGRGYGRKILKALTLAAKDIGLKRLFASVARENLPSLAILKREFSKVGETEDTLDFTLMLD